MSDAKIGTFEDLLDMTPPRLRSVILRLREMVLAAHPNSTIVVRLGDRAATFGIGPRKMKDGYIYLMPHAEWINLGFYQGAKLPDPEGLLEGGGKSLRHIKCRSETDCANPAMATLISEAVKERHQNACG